MKLAKPAITILPAGPRLRAMTAVLLLLLGVGAAALISYHRFAALPDGVALRYGDTVVTEAALGQRVHLLEALYGVQQPADPVKAADFKKDTAKAVAVSDIISDAARDQGIVVAGKAASDQLATMINQQFGNDRNAFLQQLSAQGVSEQDVLDEITRQLTSAQLFGQITKNVPAHTDADAQAYYDQNKAQMVSPEQRDIRNIVVSTQDTANQVAQQARVGTDFGSLVQQFSIDQSTKPAGGELGMVSADQLDAGYAKEAFAAAPNAVFGPVQTPQGWNVGQVTKVQPPVPESFQQLDQSIKTKLDNDAKMAVWNGWMADRIKNAHVRYAAAYQPDNPDAAPGTPAS